MVEQQLVDYIKKAKQAGQDDNQTRSLLRKNGWTDEEVNEAFLTVNQPKPEPRLEPRPELQPETQPKTQYQVSGKPEINLPQDSATEPKGQYQPRQERQFERPEPVELESEQANMPAARGGARLFLKFSVVLILLVIIGAGAYFALMQGDFLQNIVDKTFSYFSPQIYLPEGGVSDNNIDEVSPISDQETSPKPATKNLVGIPQDYDATQIAKAAFSKTRDKVIYCAPLKVDYSKISCFLNDQKFLDNPYIYKPYWIGISPNGQRIVFLYYDSVKKQSFVFENGSESPRWDGAITSPKFSDNSQSFAYMVMGNDGKSFVVLDGKQFSPHDKIFTIPEWSDDGKYLFYGARDGENVFWVADEVQSLGQ